MDEFDDIFGGDDIFGDDAPDWLADFSLEDVEDDASTTEPEPESSVLEPEPPSTPVEIPEPVASVEDVDPQPIFDPSDEPLSGLQPSAPVETEEPETAAPAPSVPVSPLSAPAPAAVSGVAAPEWLLDVAEAPIDNGEKPAVPDWLNSLASSPPAPEPPVTPPEWLTDLAATRVPESVEPEYSAEVPPVEDERPPSTLESRSVAPVTLPVIDDVDEPPATGSEPEWLGDIVSQLDTRLAQSGLLDPSASTPTEEQIKEDPSPGLPDWLQNFEDSASETPSTTDVDTISDDITVEPAIKAEEPQELEPASAPVQDNEPAASIDLPDEDLPDWLQSFDDIFGTENEAENVIDETTTDSDLVEADIAQPDTEQLEHDAEPIAISEEEIEIHQAALPMDMPEPSEVLDDVLEQPRQTTDVEERDTTPEWLKAASEAASDNTIEAAKPSMPLSPSSTTEIPDWLQAAEDEPTVDEVVVDDDSDNVAETGPLTATEQTQGASIPDWLKPLDDEADAARMDESSEVSASKTGPLSEQGQTANIPDWLKDLDTPSKSEDASEIDPGMLIETGPLPEMAGNDALAAESTANVPATNELDPQAVQTEEERLDEIIAQNKAPATGELTSDADDDVPDWLKAPAREPEETTEEGEASGVPDWLATIGSSEEAAAPKEAEQTTAAPDWLQQIKAGTSESTPPDTEDDDEEEVLPDWLIQDTGDLRSSSPDMTETVLDPDDENEQHIPEWIQQATSELAPPTPVEDDETEDEDEAETIPDWLASVKATSSRADESPITSEEDDDDQAEAIPDWIKTGTAQFSGTESVEAEPEPDDEDVVPAWLQQAQGIVPEEPTPEASKGGDDWLSQMGLGNVQEETENSDSIPDWLIKQVEEKVAGAASVPPPTTKPSDDTPEWLQAVAGATETTEDGEQEVPAWLAQAQGLQDPDMQSKQSEDVPDWLRQAESNVTIPSEPADEQAPPDWVNSLGIDRISDEERRLRDAAEAIGVDVDDVSQRAAQLRDLGRSSNKWDVEDSAIRKMKIDLDLASQIQDLRFEDIVDDGTEAQVETVGPLRDVKGAVKPEMIFEGAKLRVDNPIEQLVVTEAQADRVERLRKLMEGDTSQVSEPLTQRRGLALIERYIVSLLLVVTIALPTLLGAVFLPAQVPVTPNVEAARSTVQSVPENASILVAFEYEPNAQTELEPLVVSLLSDLADLPNATVYAVSTKETGPAIAEQALIASPKLVEKTWNNLGYLPGEANAIQTLSAGGIGGALIPFDSDVQGRPLDMPAQSFEGLDIDLLVVATNKPDTLRIWLEQTTFTEDTSAIALVSQGTAPIAYPYEQSGQLDAVLVGLTDGASYSTLVDADRARQLVPVWNGLGLGSTVAALMIVLSATIYGLRALASGDQD